MDEPPQQIIHHVRRLMPMPTLGFLRRGLTWYEACVVAERQAAHLLKLLGVTRPSAEIELILMQEDIKLETQPDLPLSGHTRWTGEHWLITINQDESLWRSRSTLAHEIKHILDDPFRELLYPEWPHGSESPPPELAERICDYFAGCVLAPRGWLKQAWRDGVREIAELAALFDVSEALIAVRLSQVGLMRSAHMPKLPWRGYTRRAYRCSAALVRRGTRHADEASERLLIRHQVVAVDGARPWA